MEMTIAEYSCIPTNAIINLIIWVYSMVLHAKNYVVLLKKLYLYCDCCKGLNDNKERDANAVRLETMYIIKE